ncbi:hypothetical protein Prudu_1072S000700 [Prunus dulcis]|uniref:Queuosine 5'-phosphate N-glycosylase/hydrolase n=1 Tax=Prunus dulcis TaxID=3755 RepID=A0A5H2YBN4_PRUDU|nr:hypothetical protein Prudu_1072S000700 [Prunus dulcis]
MDKDLNYDNLAAGLKAALQNDKSVFDVDRLQKYTGPELRELLKWPRPLPLEDERVRLLHEVGFELERSFDGKASNLVESCGKSAVKLVALVTRHFPGFRDHSVYKGHQVFLYKRAQIFAADLWGAFGGQGYGEFYDIGSITIMADYIVPAVLRQLGVLKYSATLASTIEANSQIDAGSEEEVELRACSIYAVEKMKELISMKSGKQMVKYYKEIDTWSKIAVGIAKVAMALGESTIPEILPSHGQHDNRRKPLISIAPQNEISPSPWEKCMSPVLRFAPSMNTGRSSIDGAVPTIPESSSLIEPPVQSTISTLKTSPVLTSATGAKNNSIHWRKRKEEEEGR